VYFETAFFFGVVARPRMAPDPPFHDFSIFRCIMPVNAMKISNFHPEYKEFGASGECPHCHVASYFKAVATSIEKPIIKDSGPQCTQNAASACQCEACKNYVLVVAKRTIPNQSAYAPFELLAVYPFATPNQHVEDGVPETIADDFKEALRCQWVDAYKACVVMCARALQGSVLAQGATKKRLIDQIDELFAQGKITNSLKDFAHEVRITRNLGAHPDKDGLEEVQEQDAKDIVEFTKEYLHHMYVMPAKLKARRTITQEK
jgi:hypothetical protein